MPLERGQIINIIKFRWGLTDALLNSREFSSIKNDLLELITDLADLFLTTTYSTDLVFKALESIEVESPNLQTSLASLTLPDPNRMNRWRQWNGMPTDLLRKLMAHIRNRPALANDAPKYLDGEEITRRQCPFTIPPGHISVIVTVQDRNPVTGHSFFEILGSQPLEYIVRGYDVAHSRGVEFGWGKSPKSFYLPPIPGDFRRICSILVQERLIPGVLDSTQLASIPLELRHPFLRDAQAIYDGYFGKNNTLNHEKSPTLTQPQTSRVDPQSHRVMRLLPLDILERRGWNLSRFSAFDQDLATVQHSSIAREIQFYNDVKIFFNNNFRLFFEWYLSNTEHGQNLKYDWYERTVTPLLQSYHHDRSGRFARAKYGMLGHNCSDAVFFALHVSGYVHTIPKLTHPNDVYDKVKKIQKTRIAELLSPSAQLPEITKTICSADAQYRVMVTNFRAKLSLLKAYYMHAQHDEVKGFGVKSDLRHRITYIDQLLSCTNLANLRQEVENLSHIADKHLRNFRNKKSKLLLIIETFIQQIPPLLPSAPGTLHALSSSSTVATSSDHMSSSSSSNALSSSPLSPPPQSVSSPSSPPPFDSYIDDDDDDF